MPMRGEKHHSAQFSDAMVERVLAMHLKDGMSQGEIIKRMREEGSSVSGGTICHWISRGKRTSDPRYDHIFGGSATGERPGRRKGENHNRATIPDKILRDALRFILEKRLTAVQIRGILKDEGYNVTLQTLSYWKNRKIRTDKPEYDDLFEER